MPLDSTSTRLMVQGGDWTVLLDQPVPALSGVLPALAARHASGRRGFALACRPDLPPRLGALKALDRAPIEGLVLPQALLPARLPGTAAHGGRESLLAVMPLPPGPPILSANTRCRPWSENELVHDVLRPAARVLAALAARGVTHRAVRVENLFRAREGGPVILGDGFCLPPAFLQPAWAEPPPLAQCAPEGRGNGRPADDVFALGVAILCVAAGRVPWAGVPPRALHLARLERGSFAALTAELHLPGALADLLRAMLADDAELRPEAEALAGWPSGMPVRKGTARPVRRARRPLAVGAAEALDTRSAAWLLAANWAEGLRAVRGEALDGFLRRGVGDPALAERVAEAARAGSSEPADTADDLLLCRAIAMLDPEAPLCWRGVAMMPDGLGPMLARALCDEAGAALRLPDLVALVGAEAPARWAMAGGDPALAATVSRTGAQWRALLRDGGPTGGVERLLYQTNPGLPCLSPLLRGAWAATPARLALALEAAAPDPGPSPPAPPPDRHVAAFLAARNEPGLERVLAGISGTPAEAIAARAAALARLQARFAAGTPLPRLAAWIASAAEPALASWRSRTMRTGLPARLAEVAGSGDLSLLHALLDDPAARMADEAGAAAASAEIAAIDAELAAIADGAPARRRQARLTGEAVAASISLTGLLGTAMWLVAG